MSLQALIWCARLPLDIGITEAAYRVLNKLADAHHEDSRSAYRDNERMAAELVCSVRTVQRALRVLEQRGLIVKGDQQLLPANMRRDRRPVVYVLPLDRWAPQSAAQPVLDGVTSTVTPPKPVDNRSRGDRHAVHGVTPGVAPGTGELTNSLPSATTDRACEHEYSRKFGTCVYCGAKRAA